ncbi:hypothetical protein HCN44_007662 [Aphidius gifuensis]|uniref:Polypeptide N-acetylgalactosaminyltransferase n=1 Tax=Aphidius gifuensis TaxID=684658 RepID=A0A834XJ82_APHGI|nr:polypeptide N-acetylgalactosaminyltransferase 35A [Aphidius gifuensis]KAF7988168.1 hypothetical protein HCN44_007662 [Aphidius gifuensis]
MGSTRYVSFISGIIIASITWSFSIYLYSKLSQNPNNVSPTMFLSQSPKTYEFNSWLNKSTFKNSDKLLQQLQPVPVEPDVPLGDGLDELGLVRNIDDQKKRELGYKNHAFNTLVSDKLGTTRKIPDTRNKLCSNEQYPSVLPNASVIICFYNEHYMTLIRSLESIINRTPDSILHEIILINDYSDSQQLHDDVKDYIDKNYHNGKIKLYKTNKREGLIRAKIFGAKKATGNVLVFLDSHIEVNEMWIEPLLSRIHESKNIITMPVIDIINCDTFKYSPSPLVRGGFNWGLHFKWDPLPVNTLKHDEDFIKPIKSPTMAGGLFAIDRNYFFDMGQYDSGMDIWGGENIEISFRIWMCGGSIELIPCSRVGHVFRRRRPYGNEHHQVDTTLKNSLRVAHVWMDEYKKYFIRDLPKISNVDYGDVSDRISLRNKLKCHDFSWYLDNVYPELTLPDDTEGRLKEKWAKIEQKQMQPWHSRKRNYTDQFQIRLSNTALCVQSEKDVKTRGGKLILAPCLRIKSQMWYKTDKNELVLGQMLCLEGSSKIPKLGKCHELGDNQEWRHKETNGTPIYNIAAGTCLGARRGNKYSQVIMELCTIKDSSSISWDLVRSKKFAANSI